MQGRKLQGNIAEEEAVHKPPHCKQSVSCSNVLARAHRRPTHGFLGNAPLQAQRDAHQAVH